mgnify:CR=1 FL=1
MLLILIILAVFGGFALGVGLTLTGKIATNIGSKDRKALGLARKNLNIAEVALRKVANPATGRPELEADLALSQIESNTDKFLEGR